MTIKKFLTYSVAAVAVATALACGAGDPTPSDKPVTNADRLDGPTTLPPSPKRADPKPAEFKLTVKILEKQCFGSAGCNLQFRISGVNYSGSGLDKDATYEISYTYKGLDDPVEGTFTLSGDLQYEVDSMEFGSTKRKGDKVTAVVTAVEKM